MYAVAICELVGIRRRKTQTLGGINALGLLPQGCHPQLPKGSWIGFAHSSRDPA
jgi:hypothetical protein